MVQRQSGHEIWIQHLSTIITEKLKPYRTVVIRQENNERVFNQVIKAVQQRTPVWFEDIKMFTNQSVLSDKKYLNLRQSSLFIIMLKIDINETLSEFEETFAKIIPSLNQKSGSKIRPKCLIILTAYAQKTVSDTVFKELWKFKYLDVSVLEVYSEKLSLLEPLREKNVTLYYYNPFLGTTFCEGLTLNTNLFPDKLRNLYGYPLRALISHKVENFNNLLAYETTLQISEAMNTSVKDVSMKKGFQLLNTQFSYFDSYDFYKEPQIVNDTFKNIEKLENTIINKYLEVVAVVPISKTLKYQVKRENFIIPGIFIISLIFIIWAISRLLKFHSHWSILSITQMIFGMSVSKEPKINSERILFIFVFFSWTIYSVWIFEELMIDGLKLEEERSI